MRCMRIEYQSVSCRHSCFTPVLSSFIAFLPKPALNPAKGQGFLGRFVIERLMCFIGSAKLSEENAEANVHLVSGNALLIGEFTHAAGKLTFILRGVREERIQTLGRLILKSRGYTLIPSRNIGNHWKFKTVKTSFLTNPTYFNLKIPPLDPKKLQWGVPMDSRSSQTGNQYVTPRTSKQQASSKQQVI